MRPGVVLLLAFIALAGWEGMVPRAAAQPLLESASPAGVAPQPPPATAGEEDS